MKLSLRTKIATSFALVIIASGLVTTLTGIQLLGSGIIKEAQNKVKLDLNSAHEIYYQRLQCIETILKFTAIRKSIKSSLVKNEKKSLKTLLDEVRNKGGIEVLDITDSNGRVILRSRNHLVQGDNQSSNPLVGFVMNRREAVSSTELVCREDLRMEGADFVERAHIAFIPTPKAKPTNKAEETNGMMLLAAVPVMDGDKLLGVLYGGDLLNQNFALVDKIRDIVYKNQRYKGADIGTATIFQGDLRISTNVMNKDGTRAIGTRVSEVVNKQVLGKGKDWVDEAFVVNDWYITAYEPIKNLAGEVVGILYVGILKKPFADAKWSVIAIFLGIGLIGVVIVMVVSNFVAGRISKPLGVMRDVAKQIAAGDYTKDISVESGDVVGELGVAFNTMTKKLFSAQKELQQMVKTLEDRVEERTREIKGMQKELFQVEKMASVGRLAAGVAHEINNPLTGILTNASLLMEDFPGEDPRHEDLKTIVNETLRCRKIVKDLLDFSRQTKPERKFMNLNEVLNATCKLVDNQISFKNSVIKKNLGESLPHVMLDKGQMTQVFMNILLNASDAMPEGGEIVLDSRLSSDDRFIQVSITDTGIGINSKDIDHLFDPFFSTKGYGTGLGLAISYGIVQQHGGMIEVKSRKGKGTTFTVKIPVP